MYTHIMNHGEQSATLTFEINRQGHSTNNDISQTVDFDYSPTSSTMGTKCDIGLQR